MNIVIIISITVALALFVAVFLCFHLGMVKIIPWAARWIRPRVILEQIIPRLPVNPLTRAATRQDRVERLTRRAHRENNFGHPQVLRYKEASFWVAVIIFVVLWFVVPREQAALLGGLALVAAFVWPEAYLARTALVFEREAEKGLIHLIDLLRLHVAAGMNLEGSLRSMAQSMSGVWGDELARVMWRLESGMGFDDALAASSERLPLQDFNRFLAALKQSRQLGASLGGTLAVQSLLLRSRRKNRAEEQARTASVKIALPLVLCIFPALLMIYLAPAVLRIVSGL